MTSPLSRHRRATAQLRTWVTRLPAREKDTILSDLITGDDTHLRAQLLRRYRGAHATEAFTTTTPRTAGELRAEREGCDAQQRERDRVRQERSAAVARQRHLDTLAVDQPAVWQRIDELIATKKLREYGLAVQLLVDLRDLTERDGGTAVFEYRLTLLRVAHARKPSLLQRLDLAGLDV